jgi:hypothetical protein
MSLTPEKRAAFVTAYTRVLVNTWSGEAYAHQLDTDPLAALAQAGVDLPAGAAVEVVRTAAEPADGASGGIDAQVELYELGLTGRTFTFYIPAPPHIPTEQLESGELHGIAAGGIWDPYCCSCCPNCCSASGG